MIRLLEFSYRQFTVRELESIATLGFANGGPASDSSGGGQQSFNWRVQTYDADRSISPVYYLFLNSGDTQRFTSHYFNITTQAQSSSSLSSSSSSSISITALTSSTPLPTSMIASTSLSVPLQKSSDTAPASPSSASSNTETVKVGLGVGLGLGIPLVLIAGIWIGLKMVKARQPSSRDTGSAVPLSQFPQGYPHDPSPTLKDSFHQADPIHEAPGESRKPHEAPREGALLELG